MLTIAPGRRGSAISAMSSSPNNNNSNNNNNNNNSGLTNDMDEDDSLSGTPDDTEESGGDDDKDDDDDEDDMNHNVTIAPKFLTDVVATTVVMGGGGADQSNSNLALRDKFERRMSASSVQSSKYRQRLGILRTVDLSGETIETYSRRGSMATAKSNQSESVDGSAAAANHHQQSVLMIMDEPDELKATVVMETIMTAADVAHNLQSWSHMVRCSFPLVLLVWCFTASTMASSHLLFIGLVFLGFALGCVYNRSSGRVVCIWNCVEHMWRNVGLIHKKSGLKIRLVSSNHICYLWHVGWKIPGFLVIHWDKCSPRRWKRIGIGG